MFAIHSAPLSTDNTPNDGDSEGGGDDGSRPPIDYAPLRDAARLAIAWLLDVARTSATEADDREAIDRVERAAFATVAGMPMCCRPAELRASEEDVLITAGILIERFEIDFRIPGLSQIFGTLYESIDWSQRSTAPKTCRVVPGRAKEGHAAHRHAGSVSLRSWIEAWMGAGASRAPRIAHGPDDAAVARVLVFPVR